MDVSVVRQQFISLITKSFERTVIKFIQRAVKSNVDVFWSFFVCWVIFGFFNVLKIISICKWTLISEERIKDFKTFALVSVSSTCTIRWICSLNSSFQTRLAHGIKYGFMIFIREYFVRFTNLIELSHISIKISFASHWMELECQLSKSWGNSFMSCSFTVQIQNWIVIHF